MRRETRSSLNVPGIPGVPLVVRVFRWLFKPPTVSSLRVMGAVNRGKEFSPVGN